MLNRRHKPLSASAGREMFVTDFDGTLLNDDRQIAPRDLETLAELRSGHTTTVIATGRSLFSFNRALDLMGLSMSDLPVDYLVFSTGAGVYDTAREEIVLSHAISKPEILSITAYFDRLGFDYMVHRAIPDTPYFLFKANGGGNADFKRRIQMYPTFGSPIQRADQVYDRATEVLAIVPGGIDRQTAAGFQRDLADFSVILATSPLDHTSAWVEVFHRAVSKSRTVGWLARDLGISRAGVISVGNDYNDHDLLEWSGQAFLVENGPGDMKSRFRLVESNNQCGVSDAAQAAGLIG